MPNFQTLDFVQNITGFWWNQNIFEIKSCYLTGKSRHEVEVIFDLYDDTSTKASEYLNLQASRNWWLLLIGWISVSPAHVWSHGVMVSTLDFESSDPSSNLGGTLFLYVCFFFFFCKRFCCCCTVPIQIGKSWDLTRSTSNVSSLRSI